MISVQCSTFEQPQTYILDEPWRASQRRFRDVFVYYTWSFLVPHRNPRPAYVKAVELCHLLAQFDLIPNILSTLQWL